MIAAGDAAGGFFVASAEYTEDARDFARKCAIELIDGPVLADVIAQAREPVCIPVAEGQGRYERYVRRAAKRAALVSRISAGAVELRVRMLGKIHAIC